MKKVLFLLTIALLAFNGNAQLSFRSDSQQILKDAVEPGVIIIKSEYQICEPNSGEVFGLNGKEEFGGIYSLGYKTNNGIIVTDKAAKPWKYDPKFENYAGKYEPILYQAILTGIEPSAPTNTITLDAKDQKAYCDSTLYFYATEVYDNKGLPMTEAKGDLNGWLLWYCAPAEGLSDNSLKTDIIAYKQNISDVSPGMKKEIVSPNTEQEILGGVYVMPVVTSPGVVEFQLAGILVEEGKDWFLVQPGIENVKQPSAPEPPSTGNDELTPSKAKKNFPTPQPKKKK